MRGDIYQKKREYILKFVTFFINREKAKQQIKKSANYADYLYVSTKFM